MFSILPAPRVEWKSENLRYMLCALPLVGAVIGAALWVWYWLAGLLGFGQTLFAAGLTLIPLGLSGGIHMDGYCDTVDALSSHASPERKREILKDPRAGAFAVIGVAAYLLLYFALGTEIPRTAGAILTLGAIHVTSRTLGAFASAAFAPAGKTGLQKTFHDAAPKTVVLVLTGWFLLCAAFLIWLSPLRGAAIILAAAVSLLYLRRTAGRQFGGMSGDLAGYLITISELLMLLTFILFEKAVLI